jgi:hypothetical protein
MPVHGGRSGDDASVLEPSSEAGLARGGVLPSSEADPARGSVLPSSEASLAQGGIQPCHPGGPRGPPGS